MLGKGQFRIFKQGVRDYESDSDGEDVWVDEIIKGAFECLDDFIDE